MWGGNVVEIVQRIISLHWPNAFPRRSALVVSQPQQSRELVPATGLPRGAGQLWKRRPAVRIGNFEARLNLNEMANNDK